VADQRLRWGILGTGNIARQFSAGVNASARGRLAAVGSRTVAAAEAFAAAYRIPAAVGSYDALLARDDVDAVYVSLPNSMHHRWTIAALRAGKHVLCEKPYAVTAVEAEEMFDVAAAAGRVVMEAFMYRSHPQTLAVQGLAAGYGLGEPLHVRTSFCYATRKVEGNVRFDPALAGGALMDVGCYCLSFSRLLLGEPTDGSAVANLHHAGVDDLCSGWLRFPGGALASFTCGTSLCANNAAYVCFEEAYVEIPVPWKPPPDGGEYTIVYGTPPRQDYAGGKVPPPRPRRTVKLDPAGDLYALEADDFAVAVLDGRPPRVTRADTLGNTVWLERFRKQIGLGY
jgi:xylose dehydrogenase (NAD/NADP)